MHGMPLHGIEVETLGVVAAVIAGVLGGVLIALFVIEWVDREWP